MVSSNSPYHIFKKNGNYFFWGINNLVALEISEITYDILNLSFPVSISHIASVLSKKYSKQEIQVTIDYLLDWNIIGVTPTTKELDGKSEKIFSKVEEKHYLNSLYLIVTRNCNLRCRYCSADFGNFGETIRKNKNMSKETARRAIDFFLTNINPGLTEISIIFTGGEPLMNYEVMKYAVEYIKERGVKGNYAFNTNGILMNNEIATWIEDNNINIKFSIDGLKEIHDNNRIYPSGKGSWDDVVRGLNVFLDHHQGSFSVQSSLPKGHYLYESVKNLWEMGAEYVLANWTSESAFTDFDEFSFNNEEQETFFKEWEKINEDIYNNIKRSGSSPFVHITNAFMYLIHNRESHQKCGIGKDIAITPEGKIWMCQGMVGIDEHTLGSLDTGIDSNKLKSFTRLHQSYLHKCDECWARNICTSACIAQSILYNEMNEYDKPFRYCVLMKKIIESCIYLYSKIIEKDPSFFERRMHMAG